MIYKYTGTGNTGVFSWLLQRISGVAIAILGTLIFYQMIFNGMHNLSSMIILFSAFAVWHTFSGFKMITDDYVSCIKLRLFLLIFYWGVGLALFITAVVFFVANYM